VVQETFAAWRDARIQGLIFWVPMLEGDNLSAAEQQADVWRDERVHQWWDRDKEMSRLWKQSLGLREPAWDVYLLYPAGIRWDTEVPPSPDFWMHQLSGPIATEDRLLSRDPSRLGRELAALLEE
jgi:hypothetical protein